MTFEQYVGDTQRALFRFAVVLCGDPRLAEDIVGDVLCRAYERWDRVGSVDNVHAYVRRMVVNEFVSRRRRLARTFPHADVTALVDRSGRDVPDHGEGHAERDEMARRLATLPRRQRAAIVLRFYEGLDDAAIADALGCRPTTVRSNISRGLATLRLQLTSGTVAAPAVVTPLTARES